MNVKTLTEQILEKIINKGSWQYKFLSNLFALLLSMRGRHNFCNLSRWSLLAETTFRDNYSKPFDWLKFNQLLAAKYLSNDLVLAFDPSFIPKSGKHTPGLGRFYSGCAGTTLRGLELSGLAVIDQKDKIALHLEAIQTIDTQKHESLLDFYASSILARKEGLQKLSSTLVVDAYFAKYPFVDTIGKAGFHVITRLRKDARLRYLYTGPKRSGRGRPKQFDGRIDVFNLRPEHIRPCARCEQNSWIAYELQANVQAWKRNVKLVVVQHLTKYGNVKNCQLIVSTATSKTGADTLFAYHTRFQIELLYRDAKQHVGLTQCQARNKDKIHFHFNASLTTVSLAKVAHQLLPNKNDKPFSMTNIKNLYHNKLLLQRFISTFGINPNSKKIKQLSRYFDSLGAIAA